MHAYVLRDSIWIAVSVLPIACNVATTVLVHRPCRGPMNLPKPSSATAHSNAKSLRTYVPDTTARRDRDTLWQHALSLDRLLQHRHVCELIEVRSLKASVK